MLAFKKAPSPAFNAAVARIAPLRSYSAEIEQQLDEMATHVINPRAWELVAAGPFMGHARIRRDNVLAYTRGRSGYDNDAGALLREKLLSDIGQDLRLPATAYAFLHTDTRQQQAVSVILDPQCVKVTQADINMPPEQRREMNQYNFPALFFEANPHLKPALAALSVFDVWAGVFDRHGSNMMVTQEADTSRYTGLYGIDLNMANYRDQEANSITTDLAQDTMTRNMPADVAPVVEAVLTAIENYPTSRLNQLAERLSVLSPNWKEHLAVSKLDKRRNILRSVMPEYFPPQVIARLGHAPV